MAVHTVVFKLSRGNDRRLAVVPPDDLRCRDHLRCIRTFDKAKDLDGPLAEVRNPAGKTEDALEARTCVDICDGKVGSGKRAVVRDELGRDADETARASPAATARYECTYSEGEKKSADAHCILQG